MKKALIVEDSNIIRKSLYKEFEKLGFQILEAVNLKDARLLLDEHLPDIVSLDMNLPDGLGIDMCREIKNDTKFEDTHIIIITSDDRANLREDCFKAGAFAFFNKNDISGSLPEFLTHITDFIRTTKYSNLNAIIIEDSPLQLNFIKGLLRRIGVSSTGFNDFNTALDYLTKEQPKVDLFIIDYFLQSGKNSIDIIKMIKSKSFLKNVPIIALTAATEKDVRHKLFYLGINDFFNKPFDVEEFYLRLRSHLNNKVLLDKLEKQAVTDMLTGIYNRRYFYDSLSQESSRSIRSLSEYSIIIFDIDYFKLINDEFGHAVGDAVIIDIAKLFKDTIRKSDTAARYGGEEFIALLPDTGASSAKLISEKLRKKIESHNFKGVNRPVTSSFGIASSDETNDIDQLIKLADDRLYLAKQRGRNLVVGKNFQK